jgi:CheY-like chemotaxis protein
MGTPLSILVNQAKNLMHAKPRKDQQEHIRQLQFAANNLWVLINDALRFSNIEAGKLSLSNEDFVVADILEEVKRDIKPVKNVALNWHTDSRMPEYLNGDSVRLTQILTYLVGNIQKQITEGLIRTTISRNEVVANEVTMKVDVVSTGQILKNEKLETLLNGANTTSEYLKDLNANDMEWLTARRLVELQNGSVQFSDQNEATHITLFLPFRLVNSGENVADTEGAAIWANNNFLEGKRILVVEDNKINQMLVVNMLKKRDARITTANDGLEALDAIANADFDLILMDIQMPRMDGYRAVAEIRRLKNPQKAAVPIIALTASAYINEKEKAQLFGMTDHIGKPFSPDELLEKVVRILMTGQHKTAEIPHMAMSMN